jgi:hypothetical protein
MDNEQKNRGKELEKKMVSLQRVADIASSKEMILAALNCKVLQIEGERDRGKDELHATKS